MKNWRRQAAPMTDMYILRPLYLKGNKFPLSTIWYDEMFVQNFRREIEV